MKKSYEKENGRLLPIDVLQNGRLLPIDVLQSGRSMIEMLGVLAIIGVLSVGGIAGFSKAMHRYRVNKAISQITYIAGNIRTFFKGNYKGLYCSSSTGGSSDRGSGDCTSFSSGVCFSASEAPGCLIHRKAKIFPDDMITVNDQGQITSLVNPFGYGVRVDYIHRDDSNQYGAFIISYVLQDNKEACIDLLSYDWTEAGAKAVSINFYMTKYEAKTPVSIDVATTKCSEILRYNETYPPTLIFYFDIDLNSNRYSSFQ